MTKIPRDVGAEELSQVLGKFGYVVVRQTGSHIRLVSEWKGRPHHVTIPNHKPIKVGTLSNIFSDVAQYLGMDKAKLIRELFG